MTTTTLKPGILVSLKTSLSGGVQYTRVDLDKAIGEHGETARWETTRRIEDPQEHDRAVKLRSQAANLIRKVCANTAFGLLCPETREPELDAAIAEARSLCATFNEGAATINASVYVLKGRIASTDEEAARAIASEVRSLLDDMERGVRKLDVAAIREAANRAKQVGAVLDEASAAKVTAAIEASRKAAREIVKRVEKGAEEGAAVLKDLQAESSVIEMARFSFLDLDEGAVRAKGEALPAVDVQRFDSVEV